MSTSPNVVLTPRCPVSTTSKPQAVSSGNNASIAIILIMLFLLRKEFLGKKKPGEHNHQGHQHERKRNTCTSQHKNLLWLNYKCRIIQRSFGRRLRSAAQLCVGRQWVTVVDIMQGIHYCHYLWISGINLSVHANLNHQRIRSGIESVEFTKQFNCALVPCTTNRIQVFLL